MKDTKDCPLCGETIKAIAVKCRFCNSDLKKIKSEQEALVETELFYGHPAIIFTIGQWLWIILTCGLALIVYWIRSISTTFKITTQRIKIEKGLFSKNTDHLELFRVDDFRLSRPIGMRLLGYGKLNIISSDRNQPNLTLYGINNINDMYEDLRTYSLKERERKNVKVWANA